MSIQKIDRQVGRLLPATCYIVSVVVVGARAPVRYTPRLKTGNLSGWFGSTGEHIIISLVWHPTEAPSGKARFVMFRLSLYRQFHNSLIMNGA